MEAVSSVHPLVLMSISDHFTRDMPVKRTSSTSAASIGSVGLLFGVQGGIGAEIFTSCDMPLLSMDSTPSVDRKYLEQQRVISTLTFAAVYILTYNSFLQLSNVLLLI